MLEKKAEKKAILEQELSSITKSSKAPPPTKVTRAQIDTIKNSKPISKKETVETHLTTPLVENINRVVVEREEARSITEAIAILRYFIIATLLNIKCVCMLCSKPNFDIDCIFFTNVICKFSQCHNLFLKFISPK